MNDLELKYLKKRKRSLILRYKMWLRGLKLYRAIKSLKLENLKILDIGASDGKILDYLKNKLKSSLAIGIEPFFPAIKERENKSLNIIQARGEELPFKENVFNIAIISSVLEHFDNPYESIEEVARVLEREGYLILITVNPFYDMLLDFLKLKIKNHKQVWKKGKIERVLKEMGFELKVFKSFGFLFFKFYYLFICQIF